ncbi:tetratricopeptide repeat protein [Streptomyces sp. SP17BM10]|uniref:tetratricopeptide repeat protein n=1 Tax=Streptomyces sp. SP17BM10 TaxID=3002530 RepID=UPI002E788F0E|nr:tetratricopeptide repeat protein [Streptomyces sp. SP17BM10]MEE1781641.1 tetratricopeptide repeat protein [Streptomyces sp. SP17BM10]
MSNTALKAARQAAGYCSQQALASALTRAAQQLGLRGIEVSTRQVRRWESSNPPWPGEDYQRLIVHVLRQPIEDLGFRAPWSRGTEPAIEPTRGPAPQPALPSTALRAALPRPVKLGTQPGTIGGDYAIVTEAHRRLYLSVAPAALHRAVAEHAALGTSLLGETSGTARRILAAALAETTLLLGRIEFFDLRQPATADATLVRALQAAGEADDSLIGAAILAHAAFVPGWAGRLPEARERMQAARAYARRAPAAPEILAWLDAVEAECLTRCGDQRGALSLLRRAEDTLATGGTVPPPDWFTWFSAVRLHAFKGNTELAAGLIPQARTTLERALAELPETDGKQRVVVLGDLAAVEAAASRPDEACALLEQALDQLATTWYATGMERVREARRALAPWQDSAAVQRVDDRLYSWPAMLNSLQR